MIAENDLLVVADEIDDRLIYDREHVCFASLPGMPATERSCWGGLQGLRHDRLRIGFVAAPRDLLAGIVKIHQYTALCAPIMVRSRRRKR